MTTPTHFDVRVRSELFDPMLVSIVPRESGDGVYVMAAPLRGWARDPATGKPGPRWGDWSWVLTEQSVAEGWGPSNA